MNATRDNTTYDGFNGVRPVYTTDASELGLRGREADRYDDPPNRTERAQPLERRLEAPEATEPPAPEPTAEPPAEKKVAKLIWTQEFDTLNPLYTNMWFVSTTFPIWNCYAWTFDDDEQSNPGPGYRDSQRGKRWITNDGKTITMKLRDDLVWSDGTPFTAEDFIFTYQMTIDPNNAVSAVSPYDKIASMEAPDPLTLVTTFTEPYAAWLGSLWHGVIPKHILQPVFDSAGNLNEAEWVGTILHNA